jgi:hypothetical protein
MGTAPSLGPILKKLARRYSPVSHNNYRVYVHEGGSWSIKGRFDSAIEEDEGVTWTRENGQLTLSLCAEGRDSLAAPSTFHVPQVPGIDPIIVQESAATRKMSREELIALLNVPEHLAQSIKNPGLRTNYAKYKACLDAQEVLNQKFNKDKSPWPADIKKPTLTDVIELFVSRSYWHSYMTKGFHDINHYPIIKEWLENKEDGPSDEDVWGTTQSSYNFTHLQNEKKRRNEQKKGKQKATKKGEISGDDGKKNKKKKKKSSK